MNNYPIGIHTFEGIRRENYVYVDKTELVYRLNRAGKHYFLCRSRLFGKSLLLSTIQSYFKGEKELFHHLKLSQLEKDWHKHPVLKFDFKDLALAQEDTLEKLIDSQISEYEKIYGRDEREATIKDRFQGLIERAYESNPLGVVILVDNYDYPIIATMDEKALQEHNIDILTQFYSVLPQVLDKIRFSFICGITAVGKSSFLKDYVYSANQISKSCNIQSHYKLVHKAPYSEDTSNDKVDTLTLAPKISNTSDSPDVIKAPQAKQANNATNANSGSKSASTCDVGEEPELDSPVECPIAQELPSYSASQVPLLAQENDCAWSGAELVNEDNSISATNEDSRFAATASSDFIPMDADPTVKVIIDPEDVNNQPQSQSTVGDSSVDSIEDKTIPNAEPNVQNLQQVTNGIDNPKNNSDAVEKDSLFKKEALGSGDEKSSVSDNVPDTTTPDTGIRSNSIEGTAFIRDISLDGAFTGLCGFSEDEILQNMRAGLERLAQYKESDIQSVMEAFSRRYYGYHFNTKGLGKFNPYDVFTALAQDRIGDYWCSVMKAENIKDLVISKIMTTEFDMRLLKECKIPKSELERDPFQSDSPIPLLYQCGFLTIMGHGRHNKMYYLTLANKEVREEFLASLLDCYGCFRPENNNYITAMLEDLQNGFPEIFVVRLKTFFQDPDDAGYCRYYPQTSALKMTNFQLYCQNILYLVFTLLSKDVLESFGQEIGYEINDGTAELVMQFDNSVYIFELVLDHDINYALRLIQQRHLQAPVIYEDKQIVKVCVSISSELRNINSWFVEKDESPQIQSNGDEASAFPLYSPHNL